MDPKKIKVSLDADHQGHILVTLSEYHSILVDMIKDHANDPELNLDLELFTLYLLGNIEGRCLYNGLTLDDLETIEGWEEFVNGVKAERARQERMNRPNESTY